MSTVETLSNKELFKRFLDGMNTNDAEVMSKTIDEFVEPDAVIRTPVPLNVTRAQALKEVFRTLHRAYPDLHVEVDASATEVDADSLLGNGALAIACAEHALETAGTRVAAE